MKKCLLIVLIVVCSQMVFGQFSFREGYIVTTNYDTLYGKVRRGSLKQNSFQCIFKKGSEIKKYQPDEIFGYSVNGEYIYVSKSISPENQITFFDSNAPKSSNFFLKTLVDGQIKLLYKYGDDKDSNYYLEKDDNLILLPFYQTRLVGENDEVTYQYNAKYIAVLQNTLVGCNKSELDYDNLKYGEDSFKEIILEYNQCISSKSGEVATGKPSYILKPQIGIKLGYASSSLGVSAYESGLSNLSNDGFSDHKHPLIGLEFTAPLKKISEKLFVSLQAYYHSTKHQNIVSTSNFVVSNLYENYIEFRKIQMPIVLRYKFHGDPIRAYINLGLTNNFVFDYDGWVVHTISDNSGETTTKSELFEEVESYERGMTMGFGLEFMKYLTPKYLLEVNLLKGNDFVNSPTIETKTRTINLTFTYVL